MSVNNPKWQITVRRKAKRVLTRLPAPLQTQMIKAIDELADNPRPPHSKQLKGTKDLYRIRVGSWRVIYTIKDEQLLILIITIAPRGQVYKHV
jgi:mRNA interferase RelE/StbE